VRDKHRSSPDCPTVRFPVTDCPAVGTPANGVTVDRAQILVLVDRMAANREFRGADFDRRHRSAPDPERELTLGAEPLCGHRIECPVLAAFEYEIAEIVPPDERPAPAI
jgi:hypothetical protein